MEQLVGKICQNKIIMKVVNKKDWRYSSKQLYEKFNVLNTNKLFIKTSAVYLKKQFTITHNTLSQYMPRSYKILCEMAE